MASESDLVHLVDDPELRAKIIKIARDARPVALTDRDEIYEWLDDEEKLPSEEALLHLIHEWKLWARPKQLEPPGDWVNWLILAGRGWGKTRVGAEWVHEKIDDGTYGRFYLIGATASDARDIMIEGPSGILATARPWNKVNYVPTKRKLEWANGAVALVFSAEEPERLRGEQAEACWADELAAWRYGQDTWSQAQFGLRLGVFPRTVITTTPRPTILVKNLAAAKTTHVTQGVTYENLFNLAPSFLVEIIREYENTRFGRQEIYADILDDNPGALFHAENIEQHRVEKGDQPRELRVVVAVDPAVSAASESDETGIVVVGSDGVDAYVLDDRSGKYNPDQWAAMVSALYHTYEAAYVVAEENQGGDMVRHTIQVYDDTVKYKGVRAKKGKRLRAEPVSALYEQGRVHHVGRFDRLEAQMTEWDPELHPDSPDRLDALVYGVSELLVGKRAPIVTFEEVGLEQTSYWRSVGVGQAQRPAWVSPDSY